MRIASLFIAGILLASCATPRPLPTEEHYYTTGYNFTEYTEMGFMFTPEGYSGEYKSVGIIEIKHIPRFAHIPSGGDTQRMEGSRVYRDPLGSGYWRVTEVDTNRMIRDAYEAASRMGADAVINFRMVPDTFQNVTLEVPTATLRGFAIKRINQ